MTNVFIQCGLNHTFEYGILATDNFKEEAYKVESSKYYVPSTLLINSDSPYLVVGVDMNVKKNEILRDNHRHNSLIHIWDYALWHEDRDSLDIRGKFTVIPEYGKPGEHTEVRKVPSITLNTLFSKVYELPGCHDTNIRCLYMNIESSEIIVLESVDWEKFPYPEVVRIATHHYHRPELDKESHAYCLETMEKQGYTLRKDPRDGDEFVTFYLER